MNEKQAYLAMFSFLEDYYMRTKSDEIGAMLGAMSLASDGKPMDMAYWLEWERAIEKTISNSVDAEMHLTKKKN